MYIYTSPIKNLKNHKYNYQSQFGKPKKFLLKSNYVLKLTLFHSFFFFLEIKLYSISTWFSIINFDVHILLHIWPILVHQIFKRIFNDFLGHINPRPNNNFCLKWTSSTRPCLYMLYCIDLWFGLQSLAVFNFLRIITDYNWFIVSTITYMFCFSSLFVKNSDFINYDIFFKDMLPIIVYFPNQLDQYFVKSLILMFQ